MSLDEDSVEEFRRLADAEEAACLRRAAIESRIESARRIYYQLIALEGFHFEDLAAEAFRAADAELAAMECCKLLEAALELFGEDSEAQEPGTDAYTWRYLAQDALAAYNAAGKAQP